MHPALSHPKPPSTASHSHHPRKKAQRHSREGPLGSAGRVGADASAGVAVPDAGTLSASPLGLAPGAGTSPSGSFRCALKNWRQVPLEGTKWPVVRTCVCRSAPENPENSTRECAIECAGMVVESAEKGEAMWGKATMCGESKSQSKDERTSQSKDERKRSKQKRKENKTYPHHATPPSSRSTHPTASSRAAQRQSHRSCRGHAASASHTPSPAPLRPRQTLYQQCRPARGSPRRTPRM